MTSPLRALIVDDEPLARVHIRTLLSAESDIEIAGECGDGRDAVASIRAQHPDLVFLDIQMPELDGFQVVQALGGVDPMPMFIFITAHDEYALEAFRFYALDYLLKPVDRARFRETVARARTLLRNGHAPADQEQLQGLLDRLATRQQQGERLAVKTGGRILFLRVQDIDWIESTDNHVRIHMGQQVHRVRDTLSRLERRLPQTKFLRIHRSIVVNASRIKELQPWFQGDYAVILLDGTQLTSGRSYRRNIQRLLEQAS
ncbi:MAG TPA: LytTR family DNA-binding domain-containing protein [Gemmatimonadaceae bacterium]|nr:LytTR family DNA-binding domain-containing protein [Gemmatimonadaceae bacterium]